jgi:hypothetical protein
MESTKYQLVIIAHGSRVQNFDMSYNINLFATTFCGAASVSGNNRNSIVSRISKFTRIKEFFKEQLLLGYNPSIESYGLYERVYGDNFLQTLHSAIFMNI